MTNNKAIRTTAIITILFFLLALDITGCSGTSAVSNHIYKRPASVSSADDAKKLLVEGNQRFVTGKVLSDDLSETKRKDLSTNGQHPFAVIVSCSDSRVPPEIIFDQALGDIFIIRDAGNIVDPVTLGSVEYGAEHLKAPLIVVLGHEKCGAVKATVEGGEAEGSIKTIVEKIKPSFLKAKSSGVNENVICERCEDENIKNTIAEINKSPMIKKLVEENKLQVVGAKYDVDTGEVAFFK